MKKQIDIPVPIIGKVDTYDQEQTLVYRQPLHYVRFQRDTQQSFEVSIGSLVSCFFSF